MRLIPLLMPASIAFVSCTKRPEPTPGPSDRKYGSAQQSPDLDESKLNVKSLGSEIPEQVAGLKVMAGAVLSCISERGEIDRPRGAGIKPAQCGAVRDMIAEFVPQGKNSFVMRFVDSGRCLGIPGEVEDGADVKGAPCTKDSSQTWKVEEVDKETFRLRSLADSELCMFIESAENTLINRVYYCSDSPNQVFTFVSFEDSEG